MPYGLKRYQQSKQSHFLTFSCYHRQPHFGNEALKDAFVHALERMRRRYEFRVFGYVVMPEHVHLVVSEPDRETLARAIQALKLSVARHARSSGVPREGAFWQTRYYDHNVRSFESFVQKLRYIHRNPVKRGLCSNPLDWKWSSFRHYATAELGEVEIESQWTAERRLGKVPRVLSVEQ